MSRDVTLQLETSRDMKTQNPKQVVTSRDVMGCFDITSGAI